MQSSCQCKEGDIKIPSGHVYPVQRAVEQFLSSFIKSPSQFCFHSLSIHFNYLYLIQSLLLIRKKRKTEKKMKLSSISPLALVALTASAAPAANFNGGKISLQLDIDLNDAAGGIRATNINDLFQFTSMHHIEATPDQVVNGTTPTGGIAGAAGTFIFGLNSHTNMICYNITLHNFEGDFESPANTATHIHEAARGQSGPPRIAFPNPHPIDAGGIVRNSAGCLTGPFVTGIVMEEKDTGEGFHVRQIEENPAGFFADTHSSVALPGAVRGQIA